MTSLLTPPTALLATLLETPNPNVPIITGTDEPTIRRPKAEPPARVARVARQVGEVVHVVLKVLDLARVV
jgi:hypothetical protein